ncbi:MAG: hypothetical protein CO129_08305 [Ignavibacteriales bacterium CG_4_9_14_3_um_filter_34_10]|nr:MAG: hypothetical protein CO129_08305 [Ignavibacteriales bacterium CG_4_9_14_3_um_filter_34_10]
MKDKILFGYTGLFDTPDSIINAAKKASEEGYKKFDINTPYPVHGMNKAMKLPPSKLGYASLVFGLSGTISALLFMYWTSVLDYPIVIGGKPFFALPAFVPIMFEVTVLSAAIATVLTMIIVYFKFPNISHPLHDTDYMRKVSSDKYGICIQADDELFDESKVQLFLKELNAQSIAPVYFDDEETENKPSAFDKKFIALLAVVAIIVSGSTYILLNKVVYSVPFNWMMNQNKISPQQSNAFFSDGFGMRNPVEETISRGNLPYQFKNKPEEAGLLLANPLAFTEENINLGRNKFDIYCSPCHGYFGNGDSRLRGQFPNPPSLHSEKVRNWKDGNIFHVITEGQNIMPSYSSQLTRQERWAVVLYIRALQRAQNAKESDIQ